MQDSVDDCSGYICRASSRPTLQWSFGKYLVFSMVQFACTKGERGASKSRFVHAVSERDTYFI